MSSPEVSVVIPTRDRWSLLSRHALPSALGQQDVDIEVVVVDDGSDPPIADLVAAIGDARVRLLRNDVSLRLPGARNAGAAASRGEWLAFLDDDDVWAPTKLRRQVDVARVGGAGWCYGGAIVVDGHLQVLEADPFPAPVELPDLLLRGNWVPGGGSNVVVRRDTFAATGGFDEKLRFFEDWDLWLRLLDVGLPARCDEVVMARVEHGANMAIRDRDQVATAYERLMSKHRAVSDADRRALAEWLAFEQFRAGRRLDASRFYLSVAVRHRSLGNVPPAVGALFGRRGMAVASRLLERTRGRSHLELPPEAPPTAPPWLASVG